MVARQRLGVNRIESSHKPHFFFVVGLPGFGLDVLLVCMHSRQLRFCGHDPKVLGSLVTVFGRNL